MHKRRIVQHRCRDCNQLIHLERIALLPDTETCVSCSDTRPVDETEAGVVDGACQQDNIKTMSQPRGKD